MKARVILYHKQSTSARTRFLRHAYDSVCAFEPLPDSARLRERDAGGVAWHPAATVTGAEKRLGLSSGGLEVQTEFIATVDAGDEPLPVFLARFTSIDPPFELAAALDCRFIDLTQARDLPPVELALLRRAYEVVMGG